MSISTNLRLCLAALVAAVVCACSNGPANQTREYAGPAGTGSGGLVGPAEGRHERGRSCPGSMDRSSPTGRRKSRNASAPSTDIWTTPIRSAPRSTVSAAARIPGWPGTGSGTTLSDSTACRSCCSRRFSISIRTMRTRRCAPSLESGSARRSCRRDPAAPATTWTLDHIGVGPNPSDYVDGVARPAGQRQSPLPFGFAFENPRIVRAAVRRRDERPTMRGCWRGACFRTRVC